MNFFKTEWAKLSQMNFTEIRQYIWEYYKLHIFGIAALIFFTGSFLNVMIFNPPRQEYIYIAWLGPPVAQEMLDELSEELDVIVENPDRYIVRVSGYNTVGLEPQVAMALQTRFAAQLQIGNLDLFILTRSELHSFSSNGFIMPMYRFMYVLNEVSSATYDLMSERLIRVAFYSDEDEPIVDFMGASMYGVPLFENIGIRTDNMYLAVVINSTRLERIIRVLEVMFDV